MIAKLSAGLATLCLLTAPVLAQGAAKPTDPQIAHIAYTAGQLDIDAAKQALEKSKNKEVRDFAQDMVRDVYGDGVWGHDHIMDGPGGSEFNVTWQVVVVLFTNSEAANTHVTRTSVRLCRSIDRR